MTSSAHVFGNELYARWTALWNGKFELAPLILKGELVLRYAQTGTEAMDQVRCPDDLLRLIALWHSQREQLQFFAVGPAVVDLQPHGDTFSGLVARPYQVSFVRQGQMVACGGCDTLRVLNGLITEVWSVSTGAGGRRFYADIAGA